MPLSVARCQLGHWRYCTSVLRRPRSIRKGGAAAADGQHSAGYMHGVVKREEGDRPRPLLRERSDLEGRGVGELAIAPEAGEPFEQRSGAIQSIGEVSPLRLKGRSVEQVLLVGSGKR